MTLLRREFPSGSHKCIFLCIYDPERPPDRIRSKHKKRSGQLPFEFPRTERVAIIGSGVSGLAAAYELSATHSVTLFEADDRIGGHARTVMAGRNGDVAVDTGFIVFNYTNYPNMTRMFKELDVPVAKSNMGFSTSIGDGELEYGLRNLSTITAQKRNLLKPGFWRMLYDLVKFVRTAEQTATDPDMSLGEFLDRGNFGEWFRRYYLLPISGAIWSSTPEQISDFPARSLVQFFRNHALLQKQGHQWYTVDGGSREYVTRIVRAIQGNGGTILTNAPVQTVRRDPTGVSLKVNGGWQEFDQVVFACHSDQALALLESPTADEKRLLGAVKYQPNTAVLHRDERMMPKRKSVWAAWVFRTEDMNPTPKIGVTYWMNALQNIDESEPLFVSLNCRDSIPEDMIYDVAEFAHPVFDRAAIRAQEELPIIQGQNNSWFCGAWTRWGFHEDGYASGMNVAQQIMSIPARELAAE